MVISLNSTAYIVGGLQWGADRMSDFHYTIVVAKKIHHNDINSNKIKYLDLWLLYFFLFLANKSHKNMHVGSWSGQVDDF